MHLLVSQEGFCEAFFGYSILQKFLLRVPSVVSTKRLLCCYKVQWDGESSHEQLFCYLQVLGFLN